MGAGASAAAMPLQERRDMYKVLKDKYTRSDLDELAEEEKRAWLEVLDGEYGEELPPAEATTAQTLTSTTPTTSPGQQPEESLSIPPLTVKEGHTVAASFSRTRSVDGVTNDGGGIRPQSRTTRMSYHLPTEVEDERSSNPEEEVQDSKPEEGVKLGEAGNSDGHPGRAKTAGRSSASTPAWKRTARRIETPNELCLGDVVRARDLEYNGMWFEGIVSAIHDQATFTVTLAGGDPGAMDSIVVGKNDIIRVMPWYCIEVNDVVECLPEESKGWMRGSVVRILHADELYEVVLDSGCSDAVPDGTIAAEEAGEKEELGTEKSPEVWQEIDVDSGLEGYTRHSCLVPESAIRKIRSSRQAMTKRWKKVYLASRVASCMRKDGDKNLEDLSCTH